MNTPKVMLSTLIVWLVKSAFIMLTCGWLFKWIYEIPPIIWKEPYLIMSLGNTIASLLVSLATAFIFVAAFAWFYKCIPGKGITKGLNFGFLVWLLGSLSCIAAMSLFIEVSPIVIVYWLAQALLINLILGVILTFTYKVK